MATSKSVIKEMNALPADFQQQLRPLFEAILADLGNHQTAINAVITAAGTSLAAVAAVTPSATTLST
jgi:hypothetical protein